MIDGSKLSNPFEFVVTAGARARQLMAGSTPRVAVGDHKKTTVAQQEVITRQVVKIEKIERIEKVEEMEKAEEMALQETRSGH